MGQIGAARPQENICCMPYTNHLRGYCSRQIERKGRVILLPVQHKLLHDSPGYGKSKPVFGKQIIILISIMSFKYRGTSKESPLDILYSPTSNVGLIKLETQKLQLSIPILATVHRFLLWFRMGCPTPKIRFRYEATSWCLHSIYLPKSQAIRLHRITPTTAAKIGFPTHKTFSA